MQQQATTNEVSISGWISLGYAFKFLFRYPKILGTSLVLVVCTGLLTWAAMSFALLFLDQFTATFFSQPPEVAHFWQWPLFWGWHGMRWLYLIMSRVIIFYLCFLVAYSCTSPGYVFLSLLAGNRYTDKAGEGEADLSFSGIMVDLWEGIKIALVGVVITGCALIVNFIPGIGQVLAFLIYIYYSTLMFIDFPASRYRWNLRQKISWLATYRKLSFRLGLLPAAISLIPLLNIFLMALFFPLFTVHTTLNYLNIEKQ